MGRTPGAKNKPKTKEAVEKAPVENFDDSSMITIQSIPDDQEVEGDVEEYILGPPNPSESLERVYEYCCTKCDNSFKDKDVSRMD